MCGIVGYVGHRPGQPIILEGLRRLEYRGYDSAGIALIEDDAIGTVRAVGNLDALFAAAEGVQSNACVGLGHTRWATHGRPSEENAHPHNDCSGRISIVLNGIIENYKGLRAELMARGHVFTSETDAEVVAHLIEEQNGAGLRDAVRAAVGKLDGHFAFCAVSLDEPDLIVGTRHEAPLVVGVGDGEMFLASAIPAFLAHTKRMAVLEDGDVVCITAAGAEFCDLAGSPLQRPVEDVPWDDDAAEKGGFETFMLKEIHEQPAAIADTLAGRLRDDGSVDLSEVGLGDGLLRRLRRIYIVACGTSYHAGLIASYALEHLARVPVQIEVASEYRYKDPVLDPDTLVIGITQSGETLDTLVAMRLSRAAGAPVMALTNIMGSQATRDADAVLYTRAGLEIGVAATKTHTAQVAALLLFALHLARVRGAGAADAGRVPAEAGAACGHADAQKGRGAVGVGAERGGPSTAELLRIGRELRRAPDLVQAYLDNHRGLDEIAARYHDQRFFLYLGRHVGYGVCLEGALKLKEISYIPTEAYAAGEMKHGPIALLDEGSPVVVVATDGPVYAKVVSNIEEVRARKADVIAVASEGNTDVDELAAAVLHVPRCDVWVSPLVAVVPLQMLAYRIARLTGCDVDQPRNLAKTVTVE